MVELDVIGERDRLGHMKCHRVLGRIDPLDSRGRLVELSQDGRKISGAGGWRNVGRRGRGRGCHDTGGGRHGNAYKAGDGEDDEHDVTHLGSFACLLRRSGEVSGENILVNSL